LESELHRTLLCVDDEQNILATLRRSFVEDGWRVLCASSGAQGLDVLQREAVAVVISDQRMPEMTGTEFLSEVKRRFPETMRVILSGFAEISSVVEAINDGEIHKFVAKPWDDADLRETVRNCFVQHDLLVSNRLLTEQIRRQNEELRACNQSLTLRNDTLRIYQEILEELPVGVFGINIDGTIALVNECGRDLLGGSGAVPIGKHYRECLPAQAVDAVQSAFDADAPRPLRLPRASGLVRRNPLHGTAQPLRPSARQRGVLVVLQAVPAALEGEP
jgi:FixJ family two-component response regulator